MLQSIIKEIDRCPMKMGTMGSMLKIGLLHPRHSIDMGGEKA